MLSPQYNSHIRKNLYKETNVFKCRHDVHSEFKSLMSPFHILNEKKCYPSGCVYFKWKCKLLAKRKKCFRNFEHVGRECSNCKYFYEEKIHQYPEFIQKNIKDYFEDFENFEEWVRSLQKKRVSCEGTISDIRPNISLHFENNYLKRVLRGFLIRFDSGYIDNYLFEDSFFLSISPISQNKLRFRVGDNVDFEATLILDRGRFKFIKCGRLNFYDRGDAAPPDKSRILVALSTSTVQEGQPLKCMQCNHGTLADIEFRTVGSRRAIICLSGENDHHSCSNYIKTTRDPLSESCAAMNCQHTL